MSQSNDIAVKVQSLKKSFKAVHKQKSTIKSYIVNPFEKQTTSEPQEVLKGVSFEVKKGEFFGVVGRNGSGKSTLLKCLAGVYQPDSGSLEVDGKLVPFIELGVGFNPELTGKDNVYLNASLLGFTRQEIDEMYEDIVDFAELHDHMDKKLKNYSSGMQVRLAFSIAIRAEGDVLLLDEVLAVGDSAFQQKCYDYFEKLKEENKTIMLVTHSMHLVKKFCDKAILIEDGKITYSGDSTKVAEEYEKLFIDKDKKKIFSHNPKDKIVLSKIEISSKSIKPGESIDIFIEVKNTTNEAQPLSVAVGMVGDSGQYIAGVVSEQQNISSKKINKIRLSLKSLPLGNGVYHFNITLFGISETNPYQSIKRAQTFSVDGKSSAKERGALRVNKEWRYE